jgi:hypothetical protein
LPTEQDGEGAEDRFLLIAVGAFDGDEHRIVQQIGETAPLSRDFDTPAPRQLDSDTVCITAVLLRWSSEAHFGMPEANGVGPIGDEAQHAGSVGSRRIGRPSADSLLVRQHRLRDDHRGGSSTSKRA